jgi:hypothetical protein
MPTWATVTAPTTSTQISTTIFGTPVATNMGIIGGAWTAYTPTWSATGTNPVVVNGTLIGRYKQVDKTVHFEIVYTVGSTDTLGTGGYSWTLPPVTAQSGSHVAAGSGNFYDSSATTDFSRGALKSSTTAVQLNDGLGNRVGAATPVVPAVGDIISINGTYEAA